MDGPMYIALCDDVASDAQAIARYVCEYLDREELYAKLDTFPSGEALLESGPEKYSLAILDIYMGGINGMETARALLRTNKRLQVIFASSSIDFAADAFSIDALHYQASQSQMLILENLLGLTLFSLLYPRSRRLAKTTVTPFLIQKNEKYWKTIWFVPIALFLSGILSRGYQGYSDSVGDLVSILLVSIAAYLICRRVAQDYGALQEKEQLNRQVQLQKQYYRALTEAVEKERKQRHNFKHQLAAIRGFLDSGNTAALREYCDGMEIGMADIAQIPYTGNPAADGVLYYYAGEAKKQHIDYTVRCRLDHLDIADTDLCCLLGNALDNAVTACAAYSGPREIVVASEKSGGALLLTVDNSFDGTLSPGNGVLLSKKRPHSRGIGIPSMEEICQKYDGTCRFEGKGNRFEASFFLRLQE